MSHLLAISVGPVQEFIAAARRTRDLWFGSYLLSEVSRAVAGAVEHRGGTLIFPESPKADNIANIILAQLDEANPAVVAALAKKAAQDRWLTFADRARREARGVIRDDVWDDQVHDVIEFYAAWVARSSDYRADRDRVMRRLDGRKSCRDFQQPAFQDTGLPKSSLDGQRPTVLMGPSPGQSRETYRDKWAKNLRLSPGEQLDVVGVTKRLGKKEGDSDPRYPSVARVAAETWLRGAQGHWGFEALKTACQKLEDSGLHKVREANYQDFPFEGTIIYANRHPDLIQELGLNESGLDEVASALKAIGGEPNPYLAVLVADGDKMGKAISKLDCKTKHQEFSRDLAGFAEGARGIVNGHNGVLVYAGGDDVLAFLPLVKCLDCARSLHDRFAESLNAYKDEEGHPPTLSVGVAIGHFMENLEVLLEYGRAAERHAKRPDRDGLAIHLHKRGGSPIKVREQWAKNPDGRIRLYADLLLAGTIPGKLPYDLRNLARLYRGWSADKNAIRQDVLRIIRDKQPRSGRQSMPEVEDAISRMEVTDDASLVRFAEELLVARQIESARRQAGERPAQMTEALQ